MNTLIAQAERTSTASTQTTTHAYPFPRDRGMEIRKCWRTTFQSHGCTSAHIIILNALRGLPLGRGFTACTDPRRINCQYNGNPWRNRDEALFAARSWLASKHGWGKGPFFLTQEESEILRERLVASSFGPKED